MIDTHCHLYDEAFDQDRDAVVARAKTVGVTQLIVPNVDTDTLPRLLQTLERYPDYCRGAIGLHPTSVKADYKGQLQTLKEALYQHRWHAIGEIGLDFYWDTTYKEEQIEAFKVQLEWALEFDLPVIIHTRQSTQDTLAVLNSYKGRGLRGVFHCFSGSAERAKQILACGNFLFGIGGVSTFKKSNLNTTLAALRPEQLLLETDAPYLAPAPHRGKRNESSYIPLIAHHLASVYNVSAESIANSTTEAAKGLFSL